MLAIFVLSGQPASSLPNFGWADLLVKKGGHVLGFGLLAVMYWRGLLWERASAPLAWLLAIVYALSDEVHQAYVAGRHPSAVDVLLFDSAGAAAALWLQRLGRGLDKH
jgi:VanZ family protein